MKVPKCDICGEPAENTKTSCSMPFHRTPTNRERALGGEVVRVSDDRLIEMQIQSVECEGITPNPVYHWHWAAVLNELAALRKIVAKVAEIRGIELGYQADGEVKP